MAQPQISDVGFGYVNKHESVEMPDTDDNDYPVTARTAPKSPLKSPLKSAMKTPGAAPRDLGNAMFDPTVPREEVILEKQEKHTEKEQARDLVSTALELAKGICQLTTHTENQNPRPNGKDAPPRCELLMFTDRPFHAFSNLHNL